MSDATPPFAFSQFIPGFDFLKNLAGASAAGAAGSSAGAAASAVPGLPSLSSWVAPTLSVEEIEKRIQELKTVQYWLEQNGHALKATIQALEVQKMTLSTLRGMNVRMEDLANAFTRSAAPPPAAPPAPAPATPSAPATSSMFGRALEEAMGGKTGKVDGADAAEDSPKRADAPAPASAAGVVDPMQWWGALTEQFQKIAASALQDAAHLKMPGAAAVPADARGARPAAKGDVSGKSKVKAPPPRAAGSARSSGSSTSPRKKAATKASKAAAAPRQRARGG